MFLTELMLIEQKHKKKINICHFRYFLNEGSTFQPDVCSGCHDVLMMSTNLNGVAILIINGIDYRCVNCTISRSEGMNLLQNVDFTEKSSTF